MNSFASRIKESHLERCAVVYDRTVSAATDRSNLHLTLARRLCAWGWEADRIVLKQDRGPQVRVCRHRPQFEGLLADMRTGMIGIVAVTSAAKLGRTRADLVRFCTSALQRDVLLTVGGFVFDLQMPTDEFFVSLIWANEKFQNWQARRRRQR